MSNWDKLKQVLDGPLIQRETGYFMPPGRNHTFVIAKKEAYVPLLFIKSVMKDIENGKWPLYSDYSQIDEK